MAQMTPALANLLARFIAEANPDANPQAVHGAVMSAHRQMSNTTDVYAIAIACLIVASNRLSDPSDMADPTGTQWGAARDALLGVETGRRWRNRATRAVIEDAEMSRKTFDKAAHDRGIAAARAVLNARPPRAG